MEFVLKKELLVDLELMLWAIDVFFVG